MVSISRILWMLTAIGALAGAYTLFETYITAQSAPQQLAGTGFACAFALIPYCIAQAADKIYSK